MNPSRTSLAERIEPLHNVHRSVHYQGKPTETKAGSVPSWLPESSESGPDRSTPIEEEPLDGIEDAGIVTYEKGESNIRSKNAFAALSGQAVGPFQMDHAHISSGEFVSKIESHGDLLNFDTHELTNLNTCALNINSEAGVYMSNNPDNILRFAPDVYHKDR